MAKIEVREKRRANRMHKKQRVLAKAQDDALLEDDEDLPETQTLENGEEEKKPTETIQKRFITYDDLGVDAPSMATSWEQLDEMQAAEELADQVREVSWSARDLVTNILYSQMPADEKAGAIKKVGDGFGKRLKETEKAKKSNDMDLLEVQAILARDSRHTSVMQKIGVYLSEWVSKSVSALPYESFAIPETRQFLIDDATHVRQSLRYAATMLSQDNDESVTARTALPKIKEAAKKFKVGSVDDAGGAVFIEKDKEGRWRAVMWPSNNFIDTDEDIISESSHLEYVDWVNKNMEVAPVFLCHHIPGTLRKSSVDFVGYENGFLIMSAPLEEEEAAGLLRAQAVTDLGMSHGTFVLERDPNDNRVITKYRMVEVSDLPLDHAANPFTDLEILSKEAKMDTKAYLVQVLGSEEKADSYMKKAELKQKATREAGVEEKGKKELPATTTPTAVVVNNNNKATEIPAEVLEAVVKAVGEKFGMNELSEQFSALRDQAEKVPVLEELVKSMNEDSNEALADLIDPPVGATFSWMTKRASQNKETVLKQNDEKDKKLSESSPELDWLSKATNTKPIAVAQEA